MRALPEYSNGLDSQPNLAEAAAHLLSPPLPWLMHRCAAYCLLFFTTGSLAPVVCLPAQTLPAHRVPNESLGERRTSARFEQARAAGALPLYALLEQMPKGSDLHMHLSGAVYAETFLKDAAEDHLCVDSASLSFVKRARQQAPAAGAQTCDPGQVPATSAFQNQKLYNGLIDSFSMRAFVPSSGRSGHDQFFATFDHFAGVDRSHHGEWLDEVATRAAAQNIQYLEIMETPTFSNAAKLGYAAGWPSAEQGAQTDAASSIPLSTSGTSPKVLGALRDKLLAGGLRDEVAIDRAEFAAALSERNRLEQCNTDAPAPACKVQVRFLYQVLRAFPPQQVFAQTLLAFEVASADPDVVGINFVQPEDAYLSMTEYTRQMRMLVFLHTLYPAVHIALHAGELAPGLVPPAGLRFHVRQAVELGHAERIGHGVDVLYETDSASLLREMAARHVMVEINLTSNNVILGIGPNYHSLPQYLAAHVPVALSTDDEGVSRIDLTHEYVRAATEFHLTYLTLKRMARTSLEHVFLPGQDLWSAPDDFTTLAVPCRAQPVGSDHPERACAQFLASSPRATQQWELERRFRHFESEPHP